MPPRAIKAKFLFDLYGVIGVLSSPNNNIKNSFYEELASGSAKIMRSVSDELNATYPDLYKSFQQLKKGNVYVQTTPKHFAVQQALMEQYGTGLWGNSPRPEHFEAVAVCAVEGLDLVTDAKALKSCNLIVQKCQPRKPTVMTLQQFALFC